MIPYESFLKNELSKGGLNITEMHHNVSVLKVRTQPCTVTITHSGPAGLLAFFLSTGHHVSLNLRLLSLSFPPKSKDSDIQIK